ncbi:hypothetical protein QWY75_07780 [Pontixanthobacter aestiaquae]|uniref:Uncharacterized protein n=1 Tax=Pontixanthobacter aestiaquae TaxID=1509367 RepID=A0A844Z5X8_9SPHN|nr:hypothetical protein [Pontixanthobacter aestiaquae]MDN3646104.1 hypothetical protein [Pontixanthobacter aestiaquae]MXO82904.1 hypothetical protein [Pontixanthobacter aestiaquae]
MYPNPALRSGDRDLHETLTDQVGFETEIRAWHDTVKLSQGHSAEHRKQIAKGLEANGSITIAQLARTLGSGIETL